LTYRVSSTSFGRPPIETLRRKSWIGTAFKEAGSSWKGKVKAKWGKLTDDDLTAINGRREELEGKIQQRYGLAKDQARKEIDDWFTSQGF
jgi:uncharacterized protein YjbJ (UPF0337 family)